MSSINPVQSRSSDLSQVDHLSVCQMASLLIQKIVRTVTQFFYSCYTAIRNTCLKLIGKGPIQFTQELKNQYVQQIIDFIDRSGQRTDILEREDMQLGYHHTCKYPEVRCCANLYNQDYLDRQEARSRHALFELLPANLKNSLGSLESGNKDLILDATFRRVHTEYQNEIYSVEEDLFRYLNQYRPSLLETLNFDSDHIDQRTELFLGERLGEPLRVRVNRFTTGTLQRCFLRSAYCRLKQLKTGKEVIIYA